MNDMDYIARARARRGGGGGGGVTVNPLSVNENGTYTAPSGTAYSPVTVDVPVGETYFTNPSTGCIYPRVLNQTLVGFKRNRYGSFRWAGCVNMEEATVAGLVEVAGTLNNNPFTDCVALKRLVLPSLTAANTFVASGCTALEQAQLGSVGNAVTALSQYTFSGDTQAGLTITIYVADNEALPLANSPWGAANATIIYRSSTTGEVLA
jgi:hypothetical protein